MRRCKVDGATRLLHLKMRPDTPQNYEYISLENITGNVVNFLFVRPWTQFFDMKGQESVPFSTSKNITFKNIDIACTNFFNVVKSDQYSMSSFLFENMNVTTENATINKEYVDNIVFKNVKVNNSKIR